MSIRKIQNTPISLLQLLYHSRGMYPLVFSFPDNVILNSSFLGFNTWSVRKVYVAKLFKLDAIVVYTDHHQYRPNLLDPYTLSHHIENDLEYECIYYLLLDFWLLDVKQDHRTSVRLVWNHDGHQLVFVIWNTIKTFSIFNHEVSDSLSCHTFLGWILYIKATKSSYERYW